MAVEDRRAKGHRFLHIVRLDGEEEYALSPIGRPVPVFTPIGKRMPSQALNSPLAEARSGRRPPPLLLPSEDDGERVACHFDVIFTADGAPWGLLCLGVAPDGVSTDDPRGTPCFRDELLGGLLLSEGQPLGTWGIGARLQRALNCTQIADRGEEQAVDDAPFSVEDIDMVALNVMGRENAQPLHAVALHPALPRKSRPMDMEPKEPDAAFTISEMSEALSHQIRNPLAALSGVLQVLRDSFSPDDPRIRTASLALGEIGRLDDVMEELRIFSRQVVPTPRPLKMGSLVNTLKLRLAETQETTGVALQLNGAPEEIVNVDPKMMERALWNLLCNGAEAMDGEGELLLSWHRHPAGMEISIQDHGEGISTECLSALFRPFFSTRVHGTGLGLPVTQNIVTAHGGRLQVESTPGAGATFRITLPT